MKRRPWTPSKTQLKALQHAVNNLGYVSSGMKHVTDRNTCSSLARKGYLKLVFTLNDEMQYKITDKGNKLLNQLGRLQ